MNVVSVTIHRQRTVGNTIRVKASILVEDNNLDQISVDSNNTIFSLTADIPAILGQQALARLADKEEAEYLRVIAKGGNPFDQSNPPLFNDYTQLLKKTIRLILSLDDPFNDLVYNGHNLLALMNDARIKKLFPDVSDAKILELRAASNRIATARVELDAHVAMKI